MGKHLIGVVCALGVAVCLSAPARAELVGYWPFDGNANDASANANHGTAGGSLVYQGDVPSAIGGGQSLRSVTGGGAANVLTVPTSPSLESINHSFSLSYWMKSNLADNNNWVRVFQHGTEGGGQRTWLVDRYGGSNRTNMRVDTTAQHNQNIATNGGNVFDGAWHHVLYTIDNGAYAKYEDGVLAHAGTYNHGDGLTNTRPLYMFGRNGTGEYVGALDAVALYDTALARPHVDHLAAGGDPTALPAIPDSKAVQFDVGDGAGAYQGTQSPGHANDGMVAGEKYWNTVVNDTSGGVYASGLPADNIRFDIGRSEYGRPMIDWNQTPSSTQLGSASGIYDSALMKDWRYTGGNDNLAARVKGLEPGYYKVNALVREPNQLGRTYNVNIGVNIDTIYGTTPKAITDAGGVTTWTQGKNYQSEIIKIDSAQDWATVIVDPTNAAYGTLEGLQIIPIAAPARSTYTMENNVNDSTGPHNGTPMGGPTYQASGVSGQALELNGSGQYATLAAAGDMGFQGNFTASAWVRPDQTNGDRTILGTDSTGTNNGLHLIIRNGKAHLGFYANDTGGSRTIQTDEWQHITWRYNDGEQAIFVNGIKDASNTGRNPFTGNATVNIGRWANGRYFDGSLDNIRIEQRAMSDAEIAAQFQGDGGYLDNFEGTGGKLDTSRWYVSGGQNSARLRSRNNPDGEWGLYTWDNDSTEHTRPGTIRNVYNVHRDNMTGVAWGPAVTVTDESVPMYFKLQGGDNAFNENNPRSGGIGVALWDVAAGDYVRDGGNVRFVKNSSNTWDYQQKSISLAGLNGKTVIPMFLDRKTGSFGFGAVDSFNTAPGVVAETGNAVKVLFDYHFDRSGDWMGWTGDTSQYQLGQANTGLTNQHINLAGTFGNGRGFLSSTTNGQWDSPTGTMRSPTFDVDGDVIEFYIAGGNRAGLSLDLVRASDNTVLRTARSSADAADMEYQFWSIKDLAGTQAYLRVQDTNPGGWGHIEVDAIRMLKFNDADPMNMKTASWGNAPSTTLVHDVFNPGDRVVVTAGSDIQGGSDNGGMAYMADPVSGPFSAVARVSFDGGAPDQWTKAGLMLRETPDANSANVMVMATGSNRANLQWRDATGAGTGYQQAGGGNPSNPIWVKLERWENGQITASWAPDSATVPSDWSRFGNQPMPAFLAGYLGLAATSHTTGNVVDARFRGFVVNDVIEGFEGYDGKVPHDRWYVAGGNASMGLRTNDSPDGQYGLRTEANAAPMRDIYTTANAYDQPTGNIWGPVFTVDDENGSIYLKVGGGQHALNLGSRNNGGSGVALYDLEAGELIPSTFVTRTGNGGSYQSKEISLAGLQGKRLAMVVVDRQTGGWAWTAVDSVTATAGAISVIDIPHKVYFDYGFDQLGDFMGWTGDTGSFQIGNTPIGLIGGYVDKSGTFQVGKGFLSSTTVAGGWDAPTGTLRSPEFTIQGDIIEFWITGGNNPNLEAFELVEVATGNVLRSAAGLNSSEFLYEYWSINDLQGIQAYLRVRDDNPGGWGHISVDQIRMVGFAVPEPATMVCLAMAAAGLGGYIRRRRRS